MVKYFFKDYRRIKDRVIYDLREFKVYVFFCIGDLGFQIFGSFCLGILRDCSLWKVYVGYYIIVYIFLFF